MNAKRKTETMKTLASSNVVTLYVLGYGFVDFLAMETNTRNTV